MTIQFEKHAFKQLDNELSAVFEQIGQMASLIANQLAMLDEALAQGLDDNAQAKSLDKQINALELEIEQGVAGIFSKYTLVGDELRFVMTMLKLSSTLERMGDMAKNCVKRMVKLSRPVNPAFAREAGLLKNLIVQMLASSMTLIQTYDEQKASVLLAQEDEADGLYKKIQLLLEQNMASSAQMVESTHMLFIIKNLERMADLTLEIVKLCYYIHHGAKFEKPSV